MTLHANVMKKLVNFYHQFRRQTLDKQTNRPHRTSLHGSKKLTRDHSFKMYATFSEKLTFLIPWYPHVHLHTYICVCSKLWFPIEKHWGPLCEYTISTSSFLSRSLPFNKLQFFELSFLIYFVIYFVIYFLEIWIAMILS